MWYLSFEGTRVVVEDIESAIIEVAKTMCRDKVNNHVVCDQIQCIDEPNEENINLVEGSEINVERLSYADVLKFGEEKVQPDIHKRKPTFNEEVKPVLPKIRRAKPYYRNRVIKPTQASRSPKFTSSHYHTLSTCSNSEYTDFIRNRFSILEHFCTGDDESEDENSTQEETIGAERLLGGCKDDTDKTEEVPKTTRVDDTADPENTDIDLSRIEVSNASNAQASRSLTDELPFISEDTTEDSIDSELHQMETSTREFSMENETIQLEIHGVVTETNECNSVNPETVYKTEVTQTLDRSMDEVIHLLNSKDENLPEEDTKSGSKIRDEIVSFSYTDFKVKFDLWCSQHNHPMRTDSSVKNEDKSQTSFPFRQIRFTCKHSGKPRVRGQGKRPVQAYMPCECPMSVRLKLDANAQCYKITKFIATHNHTTSSGEFKHCSTEQRLDSVQKEHIQALVQLNVKTRNIKTLIKEKTGKAVQTKDINNFKHDLGRKKEGGLSRGKLLGNALKKLTENKQATTVVDVDESDHVDLIYIQTAEMIEQYKKYPEIMFMDTTYNVNLEGYPLFAIMVEDGDGRGKPVAYCFIRSETKENIKQCLTHFCNFNDVSQSKVIMVDKDLTEINALKSKIPDAEILLCKFHVMKYFKKKSERVRL